MNISSMREGIYCRNCKHYLHSPLVAYSDCCLAPGNVILHDHWDAPHRDPVRPPNEINAKNDCQWHEGKLFKKPLKYYELKPPIILDTEIELDCGKRPTMRQRKSLWKGMFGKKI